jgi:hypothetical protein
MKEPVDDQRLPAYYKDTPDHENNPPSDGATPHFLKSTYLSNLRMFMGASKRYKAAA